jgi:glucose/arabinose dehydrogenase
VLAGSGQARSQALQLQLVGSFAQPTFATAPASEPSNLYVVERAGRIRLIANGKVQTKPFLNISSLVTTSGGEEGLLSMAFSPSYAQNRLFYVDYTDTDGNIRVEEYRANGKHAPQHTRELLLVQHPSFKNHNGGQLQFGPDGRLYVGVGDGGSNGDPNNNGQNLSTDLAKILAADPTNVNWQIVGYGLRNPWRFSFDRANGDLYIADVGQSAWEEIDYRNTPAEANYGWSRYEGTHDYNTSIALNPAAPYVGPVYEYDHGSGRCAITGGYVYRGSAMADQVGRYFFGDYCAGTVWSLKIVSGAATDVQTLPFTVSHPSSFGQDANGELYLVSLDGGVYRLTE